MRTILLTIVLLAGFGAARAAEFYVAPNGSDADPGTKSRPWASLAHAQTALRQSGKLGKEAIAVYLRAGTYYLGETLVFTAEDSGTATAPVVYAAAAGEESVISGGVMLQLKWEPYRDGIMKAAVPADLATDQLFVNGQRQPLARYPNFDPNVAIYNGYAADAISPARVARWADPQGGFIHMMHGALWGGYHYIITDKDAQGRLRYEGGWQNNRGGPIHNQFRMVENIFEELDAPGEWFLNAKSHTLYFYPPAGLDLVQATIEAVRLKHLVEFRGTEQAPVRFVSFRGVTFRHAARTFMENKEPILLSDWTTYRGGAVFFNGAEDCGLQDCLIDQVGGNAVFVNNYTRRVTVRGCHISKVGANGVAFFGDPAAVRNPRTWRNVRDKPFSQIDHTPGPRTNNYPADCLVDDCLIDQSGRVEKQTAGVQIDMAQNITVRHCSIYDVPRAGINIGGGCWGGHVIEFCDVFDTVKETGDHGSFNSWGRDRYWGRPGWGLRELGEEAYHAAALLDVVKPITLHDNRWRCDRGWDVDLDDGSSNYRIYNNLFLNGGLKLREGLFRVAENNIMVNNSLHPHVWYPRSSDVVRHNILMGAYRPANMGNWNGELDYNLFTGAKDLSEVRQKYKTDAHSIAGDPLFIDPAHGDYRVREGSPALALGFKNFSMDQFGVVSPRLKKIAKTPQLPVAAASTAAKRRDDRKRTWLGAQVRNVLDEGEMSVYGLPGVKGVLFVEVPADSAAAKAGVRKNDVLLKMGQVEAEIGELDDLVNARLPASTDPIPAVVRREQRDVKLTLPVANPPR